MLMLKEDQIPEKYRAVIDEQISVYKLKRSITQMNSIPDTPKIPIEKQTHWLKIPDVICVFVDMLGSTHLSASLYDSSTAGAYQLFTGTAVRLFSEFESPYIDVRGDGAFALFDSDQPYRALAAAVTFKTFSAEEFVPRINKATDVEVGCHIGIDQKTVLVRKVGFKRYRGRSDRQNEIWAGKPVNMAAKLAAETSDGELLASDRFFANITSKLATHSCGCPDGDKVALWKKVDVSENVALDFDKAYRLGSYWCKKHGAQYCTDIMALDDE